MNNHPAPTFNTGQPTATTDHGRLTERELRALAEMLTRLEHHHSADPDQRAERWRKAVIKDAIATVQTVWLQAPVVTADQRHVLDEIARHGRSIGATPEILDSLATAKLVLPPVDGGVNRWQITVLGTRAVVGETR